MTELSPIYTETALPQDGENPRIAARTVAQKRRARSVTVNLAESPLGWLRARGMIDERCFAAGEQLRADYERAQLGARVTMAWDAAPLARGRRGAAHSADPHEGQIVAKARFHAAITEAGHGLADILWRVVCAGEAVPVAEKALGWPVRSGRLVLTLALVRVADYYRIT